MTKSTQRDPIDSQFSCIVSRHKPQDNDWSDYINNASTGMEYHSLRFATLVFRGYSCERRKMRGNWSETWDTRYIPRFFEEKSSSNSCNVSSPFSSWVQFSHLRNFATILVCFLFWRRNIQFGIMLKRSNRENGNFTRAIKSRGKILFFISSVARLSKETIIDAKLRFLVFLAEVKNL